MNIYWMNTKLFEGIKKLNGGLEGLVNFPGSHLWCVLTSYEETQLKLYIWRTKRPSHPVFSLKRWREAG